METFEQAMHRLLQQLSRKLSTDATARQINELLRRMDNGEVLSQEDARAVLRTLAALQALSARCRGSVERIDAEIAKCPEHIRDAYSDERGRG